MQHLDLLCFCSNDLFTDMFTFGSKSVVLDNDKIRKFNMHLRQYARMSYVFVNMPSTVSAFVLEGLALLPGRILMIGMSQYLWYVSTAKTDPPDFSQQY